MRKIPNVGFMCAGESALELSGAICCAGKLMEILKGGGYSVGGCYSCMTPALQKENIESRLRQLCEVNDLVVTVGAEGFGKNDVIPEITESVCKRKAEYFSYCLSRADGAFSSDNGTYTDGTSALSSGKCDALCPSRATAGFCGNTLVVNLPDDPFAARKRLCAILPSIAFVINRGLEFRSPAQQR